MEAKAAIEIYTDANKWQAIEGYIQTIVPWAKTAVHKSIENEKKWNVTCLTSGMTLVHDIKTRKAAIESARVKLSEAGEASYRARMADVQFERLGYSKPIVAVEPTAPVARTIKLARKAKGIEGEYVGRGSALGNPFRMKKDSYRVPCILKYRAWLWVQLKTQTPQRKALSVLIKKYKATGELTLICYCPPLACHSEVIANAVRYCVGETLKPYSWARKGGK